MSRLLDEIHESMTDLYKAGLLSASDIQKFDAACLPEVKEKPREADFARQWPER